MIGIDTNILVYARVASAPLHVKAAEFLNSLGGKPGGVIAELVLIEFYLALRKPAIMDPPLDATTAVAECQLLRAQPHWALAEHAEVMEVYGEMRRWPGLLGVVSLTFAWRAHCSPMASPILQRPTNVIFRDSASSVYGIRSQIRFS